MNAAKTFPLVFLTFILTLSAQEKPAAPADDEPVSMEQLDTPLEEDPTIATDGEEDRSKELLTLMQSAITAAKKGDTKQLRAIAAGLKLPDPAKWFVDQFGEDKGKSLQSDYKHRVFEERLPRFFRQMVEDGSTEVLVTCVDHSKDKDGRWGQRKAISTMANPLKLYSVRFVHPGDSKGFYVSSFAFVDGAMRCIGRLGVFSEE